MASKRCYIICSTVSLTSRPGVQVRHYCGFTALTVSERLQRHVAGTGAKLTAAFIGAGAVLSITRIWSGSWQTERAIKKYGKLHQLCPNCNKSAMKFKPKGLTKGRRIK